MGKRLKKILALVLVFALCLTVAAPPRASAVSELVIIGMIALTMGVCVAITMIAADSAGMTGAIQAAAEEGLQGTAEFTEQLLKAYWMQRGIPLIHLMSLYQQGAKILQDGSLALDKQLSDFLSGFLKWAWSEEGANLAEFAAANGLVTIDTNNLNISGFNFKENVLYGSGNVDTPLQNVRYSTISSSPYVIYNTGSSYSTCNITFFSDSPSTIQRIDKKTGNITEISIISVTSRTINGTSYKYYYGGSIQYWNQPVADIWGQRSFDRVSAFNAAFAYYHGQDYKVSYGVPSYEGVDTSVLDLDEGLGVDTNILDLPGVLSLPAPVSGTASADDYLTSARDAIYNGSSTLDYTDANDVVGSTTLTHEGALTVEQVGTGNPALEGATDVAESVGSPTMDKFSIDLRDYFPFCVPFDLYDMLNLLSGSRRAPVVHWRFTVPHVGEYEVDIDLSPFDPVASVLRNVELLAFAIALGFATKKLLMGS